MKHILVLATIFLFSSNSFAQSKKYKAYKIGPKGDTINAINQAGQKVGKWVNHVAELRGEPGYEEEGIYEKGKKEGVWRRYTLEGDFLGFETYLHDGKDGLQQYFAPTGALLREESWKGYNIDAPYDTIPIYGSGNNEILEYKIVPAKPYSVKNGEWKYYDPETGELIKTETWDRNVIVVPKPKAAPVVASTESTIEPGKKKVVPKTPEMLEWERKNRGKKGAVRDGRTGL